MCSFLIGLVKGHNTGNITSDKSKFFGLLPCATLSVSLLRMRIGLHVILDVRELWSLGFQDPASVVFEGIVELHRSVLYYVVAIVIGVGYALIITI